MGAECNKRDDDYDGVKTWLTSLVIIKWTTRISWLTRMPPSWLMLKLLKEHLVQLNNSILVHLRITSVKTCLLHTKWPALCQRLSLAKWTLIVKHSTDFATGTDNTWLWWLFTTFGLIVCMRAIFQYLHIKRSWSTLSISARERLFFY